MALAAERHAQIVGTATTRLTDPGDAEPRRTQPPMPDRSVPRARGPLAALPVELFCQILQRCSCRTLATLLLATRKVRWAAQLELDARAARKGAISAGDVHVLIGLPRYKDAAVDALQDLLPSLAFARPLSQIVAVVAKLREAHRLDLIADPISRGKHLGEALYCLRRRMHDPTNAQDAIAGDLPFAELGTLVRITVADCAPPCPVLFDTVRWLVFYLIRDPRDISRLAELWKGALGECARPHLPADEVAVWLPVVEHLVEALEHAEACWTRRAYRRDACAVAGNFAGFLVRDWPRGTLELFAEALVERLERDGELFARFGAGARGRTPARMVARIAAIAERREFWSELLEANYGLDC
ncbi:hypothetical protein DFJ74DRAFT_705865 [Hyaloraphidium curvatum]|nr:hypothetical protein DFJ74DRAFT_705865 [Hyaloraphidium curvatum]